MRLKKITLLFSFLSLLFYVKAQVQKQCCDIPSCKQKAEGLALKITGQVGYLGKCSTDKAEDQKKLDSLKIKHPAIYADFMQTTSLIINFIETTHQDQCFMNALPEDKYENIYDWIIYIKDLMGPPKFPSTEFCTGWQKRFEISQGAAALLRKDMAYLGSMRGYLVYTFGKKDQCGGKIRLMAGPAFFLRNKYVYTTLSSRVGFRLKDIAPKNFALGNINLFGEYASNFHFFNYAAVGAEVELGPFGINLSVNHDIQTHHQGFLIGIVFGIKNLKK